MNPVERKLLNVAKIVQFLAIAAAWENDENADF